MLLFGELILMKAAGWAVLCSVAIQVVTDGVRGGGRKAGQNEVSCGRKSMDEIAYWDIYG